MTAPAAAPKDYTPPLIKKAPHPAHTAKPKSRALRQAVDRIVWAEIEQGPRPLMDLWAKVRAQGLDAGKFLVRSCLDPNTAPSLNGQPARVVRLWRHPVGVIYALARDEARAQEMMAQRLNAYRKARPGAPPKIHTLALTHFIMQRPRLAPEVAAHFGVSRSIVPDHVAKTPMLRILHLAGSPSVVYALGQETQAQALLLEGMKTRRQDAAHTHRAKLLMRWPDLWGLLVRGDKTPAQLRTHGFKEATLRFFLDEGRITHRRGIYALAFVPPTPRQASLLPPDVPTPNPAPNPQPVTPQAPITAALDAARFPLLASLVEESRKPTPKPSMRPVEPVAPKLTPAPRPDPTPAGRLPVPLTGPRKSRCVCTVPEGYGPEQRAAVLAAARVVHMKGEAPDGFAVRCALRLERFLGIFAKPPTEAECRAMLEDLAQEGALVGHGSDADRFFSFPPKTRRTPQPRT